MGIQTDFWLIFALLVIASALAGVSVWLLYNGLRELRAGNLQRAKSMDLVLATLKELKTTFLEADGSFKHLVDTLQGVGNLQQIKERVNHISANLVDEHQKISSQITLSGRILDQLQRLVSQWSEQGTELQRAYQHLASAIRDEILREATQRETLSVQLETLIQHLSVGRAADVTK